MRTSSLAVLLFSLTAACGEAGDIAAKALDANNSSPGEADGRIVEVGTITLRTSAITGDDKEYFVVAENGDVFKRPIASGTFDKIGTTGRSSESFNNVKLRVDADTVWYCDDVGVVRLPRAGGAPEDMNVTSYSNKGFVIGATAIYVASTGGKSIQKIDKATKTATALPTVFTSVSSFVADGDRLVVADDTADTVSTVSMSGETNDQKMIASGQAHPREVGAGGGYVYWYNGGIADQKDLQDKIFRAKSDGSTQTPEVVASVSTMTPDPPFIVTDKFLYFDDGFVYRVPVAGGTPTKFLNVYTADYYLSGDHAVVLENNGLAVSQETKDKPNRVITALE